MQCHASQCKLPLSLTLSLSLTASCLSPLGSCGTHGVQPTIGDLDFSLQVRTEYGVLPVDHPKRTEAQLDSAVAMLEGGSISSCADSILKPMMEQTEQVILNAIIQPLPHLVHNPTVS